jgi:chromosome segregation ATPase
LPQRLADARAPLEHDRRAGIDAARELVKRLAECETRAADLDARVHELQCANEQLNAQRVQLEAEVACCACQCHEVEVSPSQGCANSALRDAWSHSRVQRKCGLAPQRSLDEADRRRHAEREVALRAATAERFSSLVGQLIDLTKEKEKWQRREAELVGVIDAMMVSRRDSKHDDNQKCNV